MSDSAAPSAELLRTPLHPRLKELPAKWVPFAGWEMPVQFSGILNEHRAVRERAGLFDLSHMGELEVSSARFDDALAFVQRMIANDLSRLETGGCMYSVCCRPDGGILDDVIVYRFPDRLMLVVNASNRDKMRGWLETHAPAGVDVRDRSDSLALIALQGPRAHEILQPLTHLDLAAARYYHFAVGRVADVPGVISRTGYTGEDGFELYVDPADAVRLWDALMTAGAPAGLIPIGLGARDTLRLEPRYALYGNEIDEETNPYEAGLGWVVKLDKGDFIGRDALARVKQEGVKRILVGLMMDDKGIPRHGHEVQSAGRTVGRVTSGTLSPTLNEAIALAYVEKSGAGLHPIGAAVDVMIRGAAARARVVKTPFYKGSVKSP